MKLKRLQQHAGALALVASTALHAFVFHRGLTYPGHYRTGEGHVTRYLGSDRRQCNRQADHGGADGRQHQPDSTDLLEERRRKSIKRCPIFIAEQF